VTLQDHTTLERIRNRIRGSLARDPNERIPDKKKYRFLKQVEMPAEYRKISVAMRLTLPTYHRIAQVMEKYQIGMSDAIEAMLRDVEAEKVMPLDPKWKDHYSQNKKQLWQSFDLHKAIGLRKSKRTPKKQKTDE
jgi:antitoxin component of RelBE/YafQ-DinJ toxin-antitoxin module